MSWNGTVSRFHIMNLTSSMKAKLANLFSWKGFIPLFFYLSWHFSFYMCVFSFPYFMSFFPFLKYLFGFSLFCLPFFVCFFVTFSSPLTKVYLFFCKNQGPKRYACNCTHLHYSSYYYNGKEMVLLYVQLSFCKIFSQMKTNESWHLV